MKVLGTVAALVGAVSLMAAIIIAQRDYQASWADGGSVQTSQVNTASASTLETVAQASIAKK